MLPNKLGACEVVVPNKPEAVPADGVEKRLAVDVGAPKRLGFVVLVNKLDCCGAPNVGAEVAAPKEVPKNHVNKGKFKQLYI